MLWLVASGVRRAPRRLVLAAVGVAFPVAMLAATLLFVDDAVRSMTRVALDPVQVELRALATSLNVDVTTVSRRLGAVAGVRRVERFAAADVVVGTPGARGAPGRLRARLFAVDPAYLANHPWARVVDGGLGGGALLNQPLRASPELRSVSSVSIGLPGDAPAHPLSLPIGGTVDLRQATTWFSIPSGEVQGDIAVVPLALVIDYATFERSVLPALRSGTAGAGAPLLNPGLTDLPPVSLEAHVTVDHAAYPSDPARAASWSAALQRVLERQAPGSVAVTDEAAEALSLARADATNAKILFLLLGVPGTLVAAALGLAAASALAEAHRREDALLQLRGATGGQLARLAIGHGVVAGLIGSVLGVLVAVAAVSAVVGRPVWRAAPGGRLAVSVLLAVAAGALTTSLRLVALARANRRSEVVAERRQLERGWAPAWWRGRLDLVAVAVGGAILAVNVLTGGLRQTPVEGQILALAFYVLLAPVALWLGVTLLIVRALLVLLTRSARPARARPLSSWPGAVLRWLGRRPARTGVAVVLGALAVAFGTNVVTFVATYRAAERADARAALGADLRLTPAPSRQLATAPLGPAVAATSPIRLVPARVGPDRKTVMAIDLASYQRTATAQSSMLAGRGAEALAGDPSGVLVAKEIAQGFSIGPGDALQATVFPDDRDRSRNLNLHVVGVFRSFPPTSPLAELVMSTAGLPAPAPAPDFYLARVASGRSPAQVAADLSGGGGPAQTFTVTATAGPDKDRRALTALSLDGLSRLESIGAGLVAAVGVAVLGAFLVLERRRELAVLRAVGAATSQVLMGPALEGGIAVLGSLVIGVPVGLGLGVLAVRVLGLFFTLPPPLLSIPVGALAGLVVLMTAMSAVALTIALAAVTRVAAASVLREP
jgi:putative ABC transport system permease protein